MWALWGREFQPACIKKHRESLNDISTSCLLQTWQMSINGEEFIKLGNSQQLVCIIMICKTKAGFLVIYSRQSHETMHQELHINVAERSSLCRHHGTDGSIRTIDAQGNGILKCSISAWRAVVQGDGSSNGVLSVLDILILPDPPSTIDLSVVNPECWVSWRNEDISTWVTTNGEVTGSVHAVESGCEVSLHDGLKAADVGVVGDEIGGVLVG